MKRYGLSLLSILAAALLAAGCAAKEISLDTAAAADAIQEAVTFQDTLSPLADSRFDTLYAVQEGDVVSRKVYIGSNATAEEIAVIEAKDAAAAERVKKAAEQRIADQKEGFENYQPAEMVKLNAPVLEVRGRYVFLVVCDKPEEARSAIDRLTK